MSEKRVQGSLELSPKDNAKMSLLQMMQEKKKWKMPAQAWALQHMTMRWKS
jgi:hypothetical protein